MNRIIRAAATAALALFAGPALAQQQGYTPPPGYVLVPSPPPGQTLQPAATPQAAQERSWAISASLGVALPGTITVGDTDLDTKTGFDLRAAADFYVIPKLSLGVYVQRTSTSLKDANVDVAVTGFGGTIVGHFGAPNEGHFRAGLGIAYQIDTVDVAGAKDAKGLGLSPFVGYVLPFEGGGSVFAHLGFITQPTGGNSDVDVSWGPIFTLHVGGEFGK
jgi:hypothetical protein